MNPITMYLDELKRLLARGARRRILAEVRTHLLEAAAAGRAPGEAVEAAQRRAVARFGSPLEIARAFDAVRRPSRALPRRAAALLLATGTMASVGTATVWALQPGTQRAHAATHAHIAPGHRRHARARRGPR